jgi:hypothetical protein
MGHSFFVILAWTALTPSGPRWCIQVLSLVSLVCIAGIAGR